MTIFGCYIKSIHKNGKDGVREKVSNGGEISTS